MSRVRSGCLDWVREFSKDVGRCVHSDEATRKTSQGQSRRTPAGSGGPSVNGSALNVEGIGFSYSRRGGAILSGLQFQCDSQRIAVLGPNGSGKSTLLSLLSTVRRPSTGYFTSHGFDSRSRSGLGAFRSCLGVVPQHSTAFRGLTCRQFLEYVAWLRAVPAREASTRIEEVLIAVGLEHEAGQKLSTFSGGMRQRASLAQALVNDPLLLLLDEPTVSLDPAQRDAYLLLLRDIEPPTTVVMTSHVVDDIAAFADEVVVISDGSCRFSGSLREFCRLAPDEEPTGQRVKDAYLRLLPEQTSRR